jgi:quinol monooxygenase YgiN
MTYAVSAIYTVKPGQEDAVEVALVAMRQRTREERGCRFYEVHRSIEDSGVFFLYEQYEDEASFQAHTASDHFAEFIKGIVWPRLERRERWLGEPLSTIAGAKDS